jgi:hypothetical protein
VLVAESGSTTSDASPTPDATKGLADQGRSLCTMWMCLIVDIKQLSIAQSARPLTGSQLSPRLPADRLLRKDYLLCACLASCQQSPLGTQHGQATQHSNQEPHQIRQLGANTFCM